jgi:hypothetical protein
MGAPARYAGPLPAEEDCHGTSNESGNGGYEEFVAVSGPPRGHFLPPDQFHGMRPSAKPRRQKTNCQGNECQHYDRSLACQRSFGSPFVEVNA